MYLRSGDAYSLEGLVKILGHVLFPLDGGPVRLLRVLTLALGVVILVSSAAARAS